MKNICFYARSGNCDLFGRIGLKLESLYKISYITQNIKETKILKKMECKGNIYNLTEYITDNWNNEDILNRYNNLRQVEEKYHIDSIWSLFYTDRFLNKYNYDDSIRFIKLHISFIEDILLKEKSDYLINEAIALFSSFIFYNVGIFFKCKYLGLFNSKDFAGEKFYFTNDPYRLNPEMDYYYSKDLLSKEDQDAAKFFINQFISKKLKPKYMKVSGQKPRFKLGFFIEIAKHVIKSVFFSKNKYDYELYKSNKIRGFKQVTNYIKYNFYQRFYFQLPVKGEKYCLFPLQFQPEATTLVGAPNYEKQIYAIDLIAKKIPGDIHLYVKEHYSNLGHRENYLYKQLKKYPNVRLINPWIDSHQLIKGSQGVIVLTSTVGWEAMIYGKPVFLLGNVMWQTFKYIHKIENINDLPKIIKFVEKNIVNKKDYQNELIKYIAAYLKSLKNGSYLVRKIYDPITKTEKNIENLINAITNKIEESSHKSD